MPEIIDHEPDRAEQVGGTDVGIESAGSARGSTDMPMLDGGDVEGEFAADDGDSDVAQNESADGERQDANDRGGHQEQRIAEHFREIDGLQLGKWENLDINERLSTVQEAESAQSSIQGRSPARVTIEPGGPGEYGGYDGSTSTISLGSYELAHGGAHEATNTVAHEGRHAYQDHALATPGFHGDQAEVESWRQNMQPGNYIRPETDEYAYRNQPIEKDAWDYGDKIEELTYRGR